MTRLAERWLKPRQLSLARELALWIPLSSIVGCLAGSASALLIWSLDVATRIREAHVWLIWLLGPVGFLVGLLYNTIGKRVEAGNVLLFDEIHDPKSTIPLRMTPLILIGTFLTHVFGGSAGREGTALQTGASLADQLTWVFRLSPERRRLLLMAGISAGFGSVFGTPLAGAVFGLEVLTIGSVSYAAILPCFAASFVGDVVTHGWGIHHERAVMLVVPHMDAGSLAASVVAGILFGLVGRLFSWLSHRITAEFKTRVAFPPLRPGIGGVLMSLMIFAIGYQRTSKYIGLGTETIGLSFTGKLPVYDWAGKLATTALTVGSGFKGGEVTPLFFIGATFGNALGHVLPLPTPLLAAMGFAAVFAGAANTPVASTLMAVELFGAEAGAYAGLACIVSYLFSGHSGIYHTQKIGFYKDGRKNVPAV